MDPWQVAQSQVAVKYDPQQNSLQRQIDSARQQMAAGEQALNAFGERGRGVIGETYNTLYGLLGKSQQQQQQDFGQYAGQIDTSYDQALAQIGQQQQSSRDWLSEMARSMGQEAYMGKNYAEAEDIATGLQGRATEAKQAFGGNFRDWAQKMNAITGEGINSAHQAEALRRGEFESQLLKQLGENRLAGTEMESELTYKLADILGMRGNDLIAMYNELAQQEWERQMAQAQLDQQANLAAAELSSRERIASMQESGANSRASAARAAENELSLKDMWDMMRQANLDEAARGQQGIENSLAWDKSRQGWKGLEGPGTDWGSMATTLATVWPMAFLDKEGNFDVNAFTNMYTGGQGGYPLGGSGQTQNPLEAAVANGRTRQAESTARTIREENAAKRKSGFSLGNLFNFGSLTSGRGFG